MIKDQANEFKEALRRLDKAILAFSLFVSFYGGLVVGIITIRICCKGN